IDDPQLRLHVRSVRNPDAAVRRGRHSCEVSRASLDGFDLYVFQHRAAGFVDCKDLAAVGAAVPPADIKRPVQTKGQGVRASRALALALAVAVRLLVLAAVVGSRTVLALTFFLVFFAGFAASGKALAFDNPNDRCLAALLVDRDQGRSGTGASQDSIQRSGRGIDGDITDLVAQPAWPDQFGLAGRRIDGEYASGILTFG